MTAQLKSIRLSWCRLGRVEERVETGIDKPQTSKGTFDCIEIPTPKREGVTIVFNDSWRLEANYAEE